MERATNGARAFKAAVCWGSMAGGLERRQNEMDDCVSTHFKGLWIFMPECCSNCHQSLLIYNPKFVEFRCSKAAKADLSISKAV